jgi:hypothetical protein
MVFVILPHFSWQAHEVAAACGEQNHLGWQSRQARPRAKGRASGPSVIAILSTLHGTAAGANMGDIPATTAHCTLLSLTRQADRR